MLGLKFLQVCPFGGLGLAGLMWWARGGGQCEVLLWAGRRSIISRPKLASTCNLPTSGNPPVHS